MFAPIGGALINRIGERTLVVAGLILQGAGFAWMALIASPDLAYGWLVAPLMLAGAGVSLAMPAVQNAVLGSVAAPEIGQASGIFNMLRFLGGVFGIAALVAVFAATGSTASPQAFGVRFAPSIAVAAILSLAAAGAALALPGRRLLPTVQAKVSA